MVDVFMIFKYNIIENFQSILRTHYGCLLLAERYKTDEISDLAPEGYFEIITTIILTPQTA